MLAAYIGGHGLESIQALIVAVCVLIVVFWRIALTLLLAVAAPTRRVHGFADGLAGAGWCRVSLLPRPRCARPSWCRSRCRAAPPASIVTEGLGGPAASGRHRHRADHAIRLRLWPGAGAARRRCHALVRFRVVHAPSYRPADFAYAPGVCYPVASSKAPLAVQEAVIRLNFVPGSPARQHLEFVIHPAAMPAGSVLYMSTATIYGSGKYPSRAFTVWVLKQGRQPA